MSNGWIPILIRVCRAGSFMVFLNGVANVSLAQSAAGHEVRLLQPGSTAFDELLQKTPSKQPLPQIIRSAGLQGALLINDSALRIVAYAIRWRVTHNDGSATESYQSLASEPNTHGDIALTGLKALLKPGEYMFVTPGVHRTSDLGQLPLVARFPSGAAPGDQVKGILDSVVFSDGTFSGPNESRLFDRLLAERKGQIDESASIAKLIADGQPDNMVRQSLEGDIQRGRTIRGEMMRDWYVAARGRQALRMVVVLQNDGRNTLQKYATSVAEVRSRFAQ